MSTAAAAAPVPGTAHGLAPTPAQTQDQDLVPGTTYVRFTTVTLGKRPQEVNRERAPRRSRVGS